MIYKMKINLNQKLINLIEYYNLINANFLLSNSPLKGRLTVQLMLLLELNWKS